MTVNKGALLPPGTPSSPFITLSTSYEVKYTPDPPEFIRASGMCVCGQCGKKYIDHPYDETVLGLEDHHGVRQPFLHVLCDGTRVKL